ncbi:MAG: family 16 glycosylhydrolase [Myxococcota bacterium]
MTEVVSDEANSLHRLSATSAPQEHVLVVGRVDVDQSSRERWTVAPFETPVINAIAVFGGMTRNGGDPAVVRVRQTSPYGVEVKIDEWEYLDGKHTRETLHYLAAPRGVHRLSDGRMVAAGTVQAEHENDVWVGFPEAFLAQPVVFAQVASVNGSKPVLTRVHNVTTTGFLVRMQEEEAADHRHFLERIAWIAIARGGSSPVLRVNKTSDVSHETKGVEYGAPIDASPVFVSATQTFNGSDPATTRLFTVGKNATQLHIEEERSADTEQLHLGETVGWLASRPGSYSLASTPNAPPGCPFAFGASEANPQPSIGGSWTLTFQDEFMDPVLDDTKWKLGEHWAGMNGMSVLRSEAINIDCGYLRFSATKGNASFADQSRAYKSAEISTFKRFRQKYGYFEARIRYDAIRGVWPAFWLMPDRAAYGNVSINQEAYLKFDLSDVDPGRLTRATLQFEIANADSGIQNMIAFPVLDDGWNEDTITWNNRPLKDPRWIKEAHDFNMGLKAGDTIELDVTPMALAETQGDGIMSLVVADTYSRAVQIDMCSKECDRAASRPALVLQPGGTVLRPIDDASVRKGTHANSNFGNKTTLSIMDDWGDSTSTFNGGMEFDIMESLGIYGDHETHHALHWDGYGSAHKVKGFSRVQLDPTPDLFHTYGMYWEPNLVAFYVDGKKTAEWRDSRVGSVAEYLILSLQMGGWDGNSNVNDSALPARMWVDWVRAWRGNRE